MRGYLTDPSRPAGVRLADDLPEPAPEPDELVIEVAAFGVNRGELILIGSRTDGWQPGQDVAGVVVQAAADGSGPAPGARVVGAADHGGWSERVAVPTAHLAELPDEVDFADAAALPIAGLTALRALRRAGNLLGRDVLITGATGAVGHLAVQLARRQGARVTALVSGAQRVEEARRLGEDVRVLDSLDGVETRFPIVLDGVGGATLKAVTTVLAPDAQVIVYGGVGGPAELGLPDFGAAPGASLTWMFHYLPEETKGADLAILADETAAGRLAVWIGLIEPWTELPAALTALADREVRGKLVCIVER